MTHFDMSGSSVGQSVDLCQFVQPKAWNSPPLPARRAALDDTLRHVRCIVLLVKVWTCANLFNQKPGVPLMGKSATPRLHQLDGFCSSSEGGQVTRLKVGEEAKQALLLLPLSEIALVLECSGPPFNIAPLQSCFLSPRIPFSSMALTATCSASGPTCIPVKRGSDSAQLTALQATGRRCRYFTPGVICSDGIDRIGKFESHPACAQVAATRC